MLKLFKNKRGITIIEVLVSAAMTAIVASGIATMMSNSMKEQRKLVLMDTLKNQKQKFEFLIRDQAAWTQTISNTSLNSATVFNEIRASSQITEVQYNAPTKITLSDATGSVSQTTLLGPSDTGTGGFTEKGAVCNTFSTVTGTDNCPISYRTMLAAVCPGTMTQCANPQIKVVARLVFNPSSTGTLNSFRSLIQTIAGTDISDSVADGKYDASVKRTTSSTNRSFRYVTRYTPPSGDCSTASGNSGQCSTVGIVHPGAWEKDYDPNNLVTISGGGSQTISFAETGYYSCTIAVPAFATKGFIAKFRKTSGTGTDIATANTTAGLWTQSVAIIETKFNVADTADNFQVWQKCDAVPTGVPDPSYCSLGISAAPYGLTTLMSMSCYKLDRSM